jgi:hypothetical protein
VTRFRIGESKISEGWASHAGRGREIRRAKVVARVKAVKGVQTTRGPPKEEVNEGDRLSDKASDSAVPAAKAEARQEILSFWHSTQTVTANCRPVRSPMPRRLSNRSTRTVTETSRAMRCGLLIAIEGLAVANKAARPRAAAVHPRVSHVRRKAIPVLR